MSKYVFVSPQHYVDSFFFYLFKNPMFPAVVPNYSLLEATLQQPVSTCFERDMGGTRYLKLTIRNTGILKMDQYPGLSPTEAGALQLPESITVTTAML